MKSNNGKKTFSNSHIDEPHKLLERKVKCDYSPRTDYFRDQTAIIHSMPFRRLKHKTQVFFSPKNDHVCTRIEHVLHVATIAATICKGINQQTNSQLNEELAFAIGLGHDLGHAPFGHAGETVLKEMNGKFAHEINGFRVVEYLANEGKGLNLTYAVKDGIIFHNGEEFEQSIEPRSSYLKLANITERNYNPITIEGCIVRMSDKIAYFGRDIEDAILAKIIGKKDIPISIRKRVGDNNGDIIDTLISDLINTSSKNGVIGFSKSMYNLIIELKDFNYNKIYKAKQIIDWREKGANVIRSLFDFYQEHFVKYSYFEPNHNSNEYNNCFYEYLLKYKKFYDEEGTCGNQIVTDYISGMTDDYALRCINGIVIPKPMEFN